MIEFLHKVMNYIDNQIKFTKKLSFMCCPRARGVNLAGESNQ